MLHEYEGSLGGEPLQGAAIYGYNQAKEQFEAAWVDSFHNGSALMYSVGAGWRTVVEQPDPDHLTIKMYNITPDGQELLGVETQYTRVESLT